MVPRKEIGTSPVPQSTILKKIAAQKGKKPDFTKKLGGEKKKRKKKKISLAKGPTERNHETWKL